MTLGQALDALGHKCAVMGYTGRRRATRILVRLWRMVRCKPNNKLTSFHTKAAHVERITVIKPGALLAHAVSF